MAADLGPDAGLDDGEPRGDSNNGFGAETEYYASLENSYRCKNAPIETMAEIFLIREIEEKGNLLADTVTVHGDGKININTAAEKTLAYLGFSQSLIEKLIDYRKGDDFELFTPDDRYFETPQDIIANLEEFWYLEPEEKEEINDNLNRLKVDSHFFRIKIEITGKRSRSAYKAEAVVKTEGKNWDILSWKEP